jgi:16S rRNA (guanine527-N7)-methyltransferase
MGMPAILLALARPDLQILALDKSKKKLAFVRQASLELGLKNIQTIHGRFEAIPPLGLDAGVAKALAPLRDLQAWWERHGKPNAPFLALKSLDEAQEPRSTGWHFMESPYELPTRGKRRVIQMTKGA